MSLAERRIQEALETGDLRVPAGYAISGLDQPYDPMWWIKAWIEREALDRSTRGSCHGVPASEHDQDEYPLCEPGSGRNDRDLGKTVRGQFGRGVGRRRIIPE